MANQKKVWGTPQPVFNFTLHVTAVQKIKKAKKTRLRDSKKTEKTKAKPCHATCMECVKGTPDANSCTKCPKGTWLYVKMKDVHGRPLRYKVKHGHCLKRWFDRGPLKRTWRTRNSGPGILIPSSAVPSIAADKGGVFVLTTLKLQRFDCSNSKGTSWLVKDPRLAAQTTGPGWGNLQSGLKGGQIALEKDSSGNAVRVFIATFAGKLLSINPQNATDKGTELMEGPPPLSYSYIAGLALQSYLVPTSKKSASGKQVRLYLTLAFDGAQQAGTTQIIRINVNHLDKKVKSTKKALKRDAILKYNHKGQPVSPSGVAATVGGKSGPQYTIARLAYANGKLYYLQGRSGVNSLLMSTDVTVAVPCAAVLPMFKKSFEGWGWTIDKKGKWTIAEEHIGSPEIADAKNGFTYSVGKRKVECKGCKSVGLHETKSAVMPWVFRAYRKIVRFKNLLIVKQMVCSKPKPPTTRPSQENCCVTKITHECPHNKHAAVGKCGLVQVMKQM
jgi:hypothetical protein